jgi:hypothetical protein
MENETPIKCVPVEMVERLKKLSAKLWNDKNPAGVHLGAILDEFDSDIKALSGVVQEYEADYAVRLQFAEEGYKEKTRTLEKDLAECRSRLSVLAAARDESDAHAAELRESLKIKEAELTGFGARFAEKEAELNSKYVARMRELYDKVSRKELELLSRWEEKNKSVDGKCGALESAYAAKARQLQLREKALEEEFNARKEELIRTFDRVRLELDVRETEISKREEKITALEKKRPTVTEEL